MAIAESRKKHIAAFYKEEFLRHKCRLECQRPFFQEKTYEEIESVLNRIIDEMDKICEVRISRNSPATYFTVSTS